MQNSRNSLPFPRYSKNLEQHFLRDCHQTYTFKVSRSFVSLSASFELLRSRSIFSLPLTYASFTIHPTDYPMQMKNESLLIKNCLKNAWQMIHLLIMHTWTIKSITSKSCITTTRKGSNCVVATCISMTSVVGTFIHI